MLLAPTSRAPLTANLRTRLGFLFPYMFTSLSRLYLTAYPRGMEDRLEEIRARWKAVRSATPWHTDETGAAVVAADGTTVATHSVDGWWAGSGPQLHPEDAAAIAAAPEDVAWLVAEIERLRLNRR
jgi:hypothetical protein